MHTLSLLPHEGPLLDAGATVLVRPAIEIKDVMELKTLRGGAAHMTLGGGIRGWEDSPFPPVGTECEAWQPYPTILDPQSDSDYYRLSFRIAALDVKRVSLLHRTIIFDTLAVPHHCSTPHGKFRDWWTEHFPDHGFDTAWAWAATLERHDA